jgi:hypothetical protein
MMSFQSMADGSLSCFTNVFAVTLVQDGTMLSGNFDSVTLTCTNDGRTATQHLPPGPIVNGAISGLNLSFDLGTPELHQTGAVSRRGLSGMARWVLHSGPLYGVWSATRLGAAV